jgi:hypothetical protein
VTATQPEGLPPLEQYREGLEKALQYGEETCTFDTIASGVNDRTAQYWPVSERSVIVTQKDGTDWHFWLAAGNIAELQAATPLILEEGRVQGCNRATLVGRRGWLRSFLTGTGWTQVTGAVPAPLVMMECAL